MNGEANWIGGLVSFGPLDVDAALSLVHEVLDVGTSLGVDSHALAASNVADNGLSFYRVTAAGTINQQVIHALHLQRLVARRGSLRSGPANLWGGAAGSCLFGRRKLVHYLP